MRGDRPPRVGSRMFPQGNLFGTYNEFPISRSSFGTVGRAIPKAQGTQTSFNFGGPGMPASQHTSLPGPRKPWFPKGVSFREGLKQGGKMFFRGPPLLIDAAIGTAVVVGGTISGAAQWGSRTGLEEDYVGGAVYGGAKGMGHATGMSIGGIAGGTIGTAIGAMLGPVGATVGGLAGSLVGFTIGDQLGGALANSPAKQLGMAARAISRTARAIDRVQFGGNFIDSRSAYTMRQRAVQEMSGSMLNARQFLGNESAFFHER